MEQEGTKTFAPGLYRMEFDKTTGELTKVEPVYVSTDVACPYPGSAKRDKAHLERGKR